MLHLWQRALQSATLSACCVIPWNILNCIIRWSPACRRWSKDPRVRYLISSYETDAKDHPYEIHRRTTDVVIMLSGEELMSVSWREAVKEADTPYNKEEDVQYTTGEPITVWHAAQGRFAIFLPGEPHKEGVAIGLPSKVKKVVFKIYD